MILSYARVSTAEQARDNATSIPEQLRKNRLIAQLRGVDKFDVVEYVDEGVSGALPLSQRPAGAQLMRDAKPKDILVAAKLDRVFRSSTDALTTMERLKERQVEVILIAMGNEPVGQSATSKLFFEMLAAFADFERSLINERTRDGRIGKRAKQGHLGGAAPYGYRKVGCGKQSFLAADDKEQEVVQFIVQRWPHDTLAGIARALAGNGVFNREGKPLHKMQIWRIWDREQRRAEWEKAAA